VNDGEILSLTYDLCLQINTSLSRQVMWRAVTGTGYWLVLSIV